MDLQNICRARCNVSSVRSVDEGSDISETRVQQLRRAPRPGHLPADVDVPERNSKWPGREHASGPARRPALRSLGTRLAAPPPLRRRPTLTRVRLEDRLGGRGEFSAARRIARCERADWVSARRLPASVVLRRASCKRSPPVPHRRVARHADRTSGAGLGPRRKERRVFRHGRLQPDAVHGHERLRSLRRATPSTGAARPHGRDRRSRPHHLVAGRHRLRDALHVELRGRRARDADSAPCGKLGLLRLVRRPAPAPATVR